MNQAAERCLDCRGDALALMLGLKQYPPVVDAGKARLYSDG